MVVHPTKGTSYSCYQLNKTRKKDYYYKDYKWCDTRDEQYWTGKYNRYVGKRRIIMRGEVARLRYLVLYCLKNYYIKQANQVEDGKFITKWRHEYELERASKFKYSCGQIENLENGDIYVHEQHAYWNKWKEDKPSSVEIIIDGHRYKIK